MFLQEQRTTAVIVAILRCLLSFCKYCDSAGDTSMLLTREYVQVSVLGLILGELGILHGIIAGLGLYELVFFAEANVPVGMETGDMLNELLDGHGGPLAVLLAVLPFLKSRNVTRRIIQIVVGGVETFPKNRSEIVKIRYRKTPERRQNIFSNKRRIKMLQNVKRFHIRYVYFVEKHNLNIVM